MPCYHPITAYRSRAGRNANGSWPIVFKESEGYSDMTLEINCGQCIGCKLEYARQWAVRGMHELKDHRYATYLTLTYNGDHLPRNGSLNVIDIQNFLKRLRKFTDPIKLRYIQCGEYGEKDGRPHHHMILYGFEFPDKKFLKYHNGNKLYVSQIAERLWKKGFVTIGDVTFESINYVARYVIKKQGSKVDEDRAPEYITMSRNPGLGMKHYEQYAEEIYESDTVIIRGKEFRPPKAYDDKYIEKNKKRMAQIKRKREVKAKENRDSLERLQGKEKTARKRAEGKKRNET